MPAEITLDVSDLLAFADEVPLSKQKVDLAMARALNWSSERGYTAVKRSISKSTGLKQSDFNRSKGLLLIKARKGAPLETKVVARSQWTPLGYFDPVMRIKGASARAWGKRRTYRGTFVATFKSGHTGIFQRVPKMGAGNQPIMTSRQRTFRRGKLVFAKGTPVPVMTLRELWGPSLAQELVRPPNPEVFHETVHAVLPARLEHELGRSLASLRGKNIVGAAYD